MGDQVARILARVHARACGVTPVSRQDYVLIASALCTAYRQSERNGAEQTGVRRSILQLADALAHTNPRFNRQMFLDAATGYPGMLE